MKNLLFLVLGALALGCAGPLIAGNGSQPAKTSVVPSVSIEADFAFFGDNILTFAEQPLQLILSLLRVKKLFLLAIVKIGAAALVALFR